MTPGRKISELIAAARRGVEQVYRDGYGYTKAGIMLEHLTPATNRPRTLFEDHDALERRERLIGALDSVNGKYGRMTVVPAAQGFKREWKMRADMKSPPGQPRSPKCQACELDGLVKRQLAKKLRAKFNNLTHSLKMAKDHTVCFAP